MSKGITLDLSQFKHVSSDEKSTTLQHKLGHTLTVLHSALNPTNQEQFKALAKASKAEKKSEEPKEAKASEETPPRQMLADGGMPTQQGPIEQAIDVATAGAGQAAPAIPSELDAKRELYNRNVANSSPLYASGVGDGADKMFLPDGKAPQALDSSAWQQAEGQYQDQIKSKNDAAALTVQKFAEDNKARAAAGLPPLDLPPGIQTDTNPVAGTDVSSFMQQPAVAPQQAAAPRDPGNDPEGMLRSGYNSQMAGINAGAKAQGDLGNAKAALLQQDVEARQKAQSVYQQHYDDLEKERQAAIQDVKDGHIDPNAYWTGDKNGNGGHSKILAGIGMILAGFNPTNSPNAAISFINHQMDNNLQAQKENLASKQNLLASNLRQFGNLRDATDMTRVMQNDMVQHQLEQAAATAQSPLAKAAALQAAGQLKMQSAPLFQQFAMRRAMMQLANDPSAGGNEQALDHMIQYMRATNPEQAKEMESRRVPGYGIGTIPVPNEVRGTLVAKDQLGQMSKRFYDWAAKHSGSISPTDIAQGKTMAAELQSAYRNSINGGVFKKGEQEFIDQIVDSDPTKFFNKIRVLPKLKEVINSNDMQASILAKGYGLKVPDPIVHLPPEQQKLAQWARQNPGDQRSSMILQKLNLQH